VKQGKPAGGWERNPNVLLVTEQKTNRIIALDTEKDWSRPEAHLWSWAPGNDPAVRASHKDWFTLLDEVKPIVGSTKLLVTASGGAVAIVDIWRCAVTWYAYAGGNPHSAAIANDGTVFCVASEGNALAVIKTGEGTGPEQIVRLPDAHGVCFDRARRRVVALGGEKVQFFTWNERAASGTRLAADGELPLPCRIGTRTREYPGGHDLAPAGTTPAWYYVSDVDCMWLLDSEEREFEPCPLRRRVANVKSISRRVADGRTVVVRAAEQWWTDTVEEIAGPNRWTLLGSRIYKARWLNGSH